MAIQLGAASRLSKLQSEHVRLCINSLALKPGVQEHATGEEIDLLQSSVRRAAEAAMNTVQMHSDAAKGDMSLSYSVDVGPSYFAHFAHSVLFVQTGRIANQLTALSTSQSH
jgi:hypothetical protein